MDEDNENGYYLETRQVEHGVQDKAEEGQDEQDEQEPGE